MNMNRKGFIIAATKVDQIAAKRMKAREKFERSDIGKAAEAITGFGFVMAYPIVVPAMLVGNMLGLSGKKGREPKVDTSGCTNEELSAIKAFSSLCKQIDVFAEQHKNVEGCDGRSLQSYFRFEFIEFRPEQVLFKTNTNPSNLLLQYVDLDWRWY